MPQSLSHQSSNCSPLAAAADGVAVRPPTVLQLLERAETALLLSHQLAVEGRIALNAIREARTRLV